ncbi:MAG: PKD domain-containing protein, partial [Bacteroidota bacterium]|nr:PKD domain-containing protein [Bacteroidota bacterium]
MKRITPIAFLLAILCSNTAIFSQYANLEFIENKGQWDKKVRFKGTMNDGAFFLEEKGFRVVLRKSEDIQQLHNLMHGLSMNNSTSNSRQANITPELNGSSNNGTEGKARDGVTVHSHAYDVQFVNASIPVIAGDKALQTFNNYFIGNDSSKWKGNCKIFQAVNYQNIYPGIDSRYYTNEGQLKYDLIVQPGADYSTIIMKYDGVDALEVKNEQLVIKTSVGEVREMAPYAFQVINGQKKEVVCRFKVVGKTVHFVVENYVKTAALIIDPVLIFSTFTGSTADNWGYTATYGPDGSFYAGGIVFSTGFPTSPGAFSTTYGGGVSEGEGGGYDIGIMKFSPNGSNRVYATYLGGSGNEQPHSLVVDPQGNLVIAGRSDSQNYPVKVSDKPAGQYDIILTKLDATGSNLIGSRTIGGSGNDGVNIRAKYSAPYGTESIRRNYGDDARSEVILDKSGNIWLASNTQSTNFPVTADAFQKTSAGAQDAVIIKASSDLSTVIYSTLLGGNDNDAAFVLAINPTNNNIYVGGNTVSTDFPGDKSNVLYSTFQGGETDGFVSILSSDGKSLIKTSYMGTQGSDMLYGIQFDKFSYPYIMGTTNGSWPVINAPFSQPSGKQFIAKLKPDLSAFEYSTVFGTAATDPNISPVAFLVDRCENVYVSGWGGSTDVKANYKNAGTNGLPVTPDAIQKNTDNSDFYFFVLERNASSQLYGSFFGQSGGFGEHVDGGTSRFDKNGIIYQAICANCELGATFPTTPGVWSPSNGSKGCNLAAVKIAFNLAGVAGSVRSSIEGKINDSSGCVPLTVDFIDTLAEGKRYEWNFGDGSPNVQTTTASISHTFNAVGSYRVRLTSIDSSKCNIADTAYTTIRVRTDKGILSFTPKKLLPCDSFNYQFNNNSYVSPAGRTFAKNSFRWEFGDKTAPVIAGLETLRHSFPAPGVYKVKLVLSDTNFCNGPDSIEVSLRIATNVKADFQTPSTGCAPYTAKFDNTSSGGQNFYWTFGDESTSNEVSPTHLYATPGTYFVKLKAVDSSTCNLMDSTNFTIVVSGKPTASFVFTPDPPQENTSVQFTNNSINATHYIWKFGDGDSLLTRSSSPINHVYNETKLFNACLVALNNAGCPDTACHSLQARIVPLLDVPNAFTPNGDGVNDKVFVRGFGINRMNWHIYNRWGVLV